MSGNGGWMPNVMGNGNGTTRIRKAYSTATQQRLAKLKENSWVTLGTGGLHLLVQTPEGENQNDWISLHVVDFFNELSMFAEMATMHEDAAQYSMPGKGFPQGFVYKWRDVKSKKAQNVSGPVYVNFTISYIDGLLGDTSIFPDSDPPVYSAKFIPSVKEIYVKMFRVYAILYGAFLETLKGMDMQQDLNTSFKHYVFFGICHALLPAEKELTPLKQKVDDFKTQYEQANKENPGKHKNSAIHTEKTIRSIDVNTGGVQKDI